MIIARYPARAIKSPAASSPPAAPCLIQVSRMDGKSTAQPTASTAPVAIQMGRIRRSGLTDTPHNGHETIIDEVQQSRKAHGRDLAPGRQKLLDAQKAIENLV